jgi:transcriptional regulator with XRE-family HTH domain
MSSVTTPNRVREFRKALQFTVRELAADAGLDHSALVRIENGDRVGLPATRAAIAKALGIDPTLVFPGDLRVPRWIARNQNEEKA